MQVSTYEITFPFSDDKHVLINGLYGAVDIVLSEEAELITQAKNDSSLLERLSSSRLETLIERGHIVRNMNQEAQGMRIISRLHTLLMSRRFVGIVLMPTYDCNLRCVYCYERHRLSRGQEWLEHTITASVLEGIFMQVKDFKARGYSIRSCTLYGGEPLLVRNKALIRDICERCRDNDLTIGAVTNGCELEHFIDIIEEFKFSNLQITVDGLKEIHDSQRPFAGGGGSYDKIMSNIGLALENKIKVSVRTNVTARNISELKTLIDDFKSRGFIGNPNFRYYFKAVEDYTNTITDEDVLNELIRIGRTPEEAILFESA
ncbi:MAG: radical SAM protein, partial [Synergistaceae bacterium]|nr:radical SAM protein [Synergistaceae bacterium]